MAYTRKAIFLRWSSGTTKRAFKTLQADYGGAGKLKPASYARSLTDGALLAVYGAKKPRSCICQIWGKDTVSGTANDGVEEIDYGTIDELQAAWAATDLEVKGFEDTAYWPCEWKGDWDMMLEYDPFRINVIVTMVLEEK